MTLDGLMRDRRHHIVAVDYFLVYAVQATAHAQLYSRGLIERVRWFVPTSHPVEYRPGVVHINESDFDQYDNAVQRCISDPESSTLRQATAEQMRLSIRALSRANWGVERHPSGTSVRHLIDVAAKAMAFYNFNDETDLPARLRQVPELRGYSDLLLQALTPAVTPYLLLFASRASEAGLSPFGRDRFLRGAAFLQHFDLVSGCEPEVPPSDDYQVHVPGVEEEDKWLARTARRRQAFASLRSTICPQADGDGRLVWELLDLAAVAADHEESRHYWQGRTMRNLRRCCAATGLDLRTATLEEIATSWTRVSACC